MITPSGPKVIGSLVLGAIDVWLVAEAASTVVSVGLTMTGWIED